MDADSYEFDVFVSYSRTIRSKAQSLVERLRRDRVSVFIDDDGFETPGPLYELINEKLDSSRHLLLCHSSGIDAFGWVAHEYSYAVYKLHRTPILLQIDDCDMPMSLKQLHYVDWREESDEAYSQILKQIGRGGEGQGAGLASVSPDTPNSGTVRMSGLPFHLSGWNGDYEVRDSTSKNGRPVWQRPEHRYSRILPLPIVGVTLWFDGNTWVLQRDCDGEDRIMLRSLHSEQTPVGPWEGGARVQ